LTPTDLAAAQNATILGGTMVAKPHRCCRNGAQRRAEEKEKKRKKEEERKKAADAVQQFPRLRRNEFMFTIAWWLA
jgi:hypothetical protein